MNYETLSLEVDEHGIALVTIDVPNETLNVWNLSLITDFEKLVDHIVNDANIKGVVIASGKKNGFLAGADLRMIADLPEDISVEEALLTNQRLQNVLRKLETSGHDSKDLQRGTAYAKPVAVALNGIALGGGMELALACHYRVATDGKFKMGQPEVKVGLIPGAGGTQRIMRIAGVQNALDLCVNGRQIDAQKALKLGLIDEIAPASQLIEKAKAWILATPEYVAPWDRKGFRIPGGSGAMDHRVVPVFAGAAAIGCGQSNNNYPAVRAIQSVIYEGSIVPIDVGLSLESKYFTKCMMSSTARNMIRTLFINKLAAEKGMARPKNIPKSIFKKVAVLGAGMMGAGIAYVSARAGLEVVLLDRDLEAAQKGKEYSKKLNDKAISRGKLSQNASEDMLSRIVPTTNYSDLSDVDLVIEAVFENPKVKADVIKATEAVIGKDVIFASNTSTIPISNLAKNSERPEQFIGIHFFSPVDKMPLVEIISANNTGDRALAAALDFVAAIGKTPIVVADHRGFYCNSVVIPYINEALLMVKEGVKPSLIENAAVQLGMPLGPLALVDETSLELALSVARATQAEMGNAYIPTGTESLLELLVDSLGRKGKKNGKGIYDYSADGGKQIWPELVEHYPLLEQQPTLSEVKDRLLFIQLSYASHMLDKNVVKDPQSADLGAILGWGFAPWTGGPMSYIDTMGVDIFVNKSKALAQIYGTKFQPPESFEVLVKKQQSLYSQKRKDLL